MSGDKSIEGSTYQTRATHYISHLRVPFDIHERRILNKTALGVYEFDAKPGRAYWTYLTSGMSERGQNAPSESEHFTELLFYARERSPWVVELLVNLSAYPFEYNEPLNPGDTIALAGPIRPGSTLTALLLLEPFLEQAHFQFMDVAGFKVVILWALPITTKEYELIASEQTVDITKMISHDQLPGLLDLQRGDIDAWLRSRG